MKHILMVDDNTTNLKVAAQVLQPFYQLSMAKSGKQALSFLKKNKPDLILLDINMPDMNGYETLEEIKLNPNSSNIPVIFLTASNDIESEVKGMQMGALDFITKPFEEQVMLSRIEKVLQMEEMRKDFISGADSFNDDFVDEEMLESKVYELLIHDSICLIYADFDKFNSMNMYYGSNFGEELINSFVFKLKEVFSNGYICRIGSNGFSIIFVRRNDTDIEGYLSYITNDCVKYVSEKLNVTDISCSAVAALSGLHGNSYAELFKAADKGMYYVKKTDNISYIIYDGK